MLPLYLFADPQSSFDCDDCPDNVLLISANETVVDVFGGVLDAAALVLVIVVMVFWSGATGAPQGRSGASTGRSISPASR